MEFSSLQHTVVCATEGGCPPAVCLSRITEAGRDGEGQQRESKDGLGQTDQRWPSFHSACDSTKLFCLAARGSGHREPDMLFIQK